YGPETQLPADDVRSAQPWVDYFAGGRPAPRWLARLDAIREVLTSGGGDPGQWGLCWVVGRRPRPAACPCPTTLTQAGPKGAAEMHLGPLSAAEMTEITRLLGT